MSTPFLQTILGRGPARVCHWEHWSCPDAETCITGIDYYEHPRLCRLKMQALYPFLDLQVPDDDSPLPRPDDLFRGESARTDEEGHRRVRWGQDETSHWDHGALFPTPADCLAWSPLENADMTGKPWNEARDYSDEERLYQEFRAQYPAAWGDKPPADEAPGVGFYNSTFMWPLLVFGWENFMAICLEPEFERVMDEFAEINRRVFRVFARLPVRWVCSHDDIVTSRGPVCSPAWMYKHVFPRYEELWGLVRDAGKEVVFMADGCMDAHVDDILACGARGVITEPYTDFKAAARRHHNAFLAGEGDNRVLMRNDPAEIRRMVESMAETARMSNGYMMCIGNHIPWNVPPHAVRRYLDLSAELAYR